MFTKPRCHSARSSRGGPARSVLCAAVAWRRSPFSVGDFVAEGEKIAELDQGELANQQEEIGQALTAAQAQLATYQSQNNRQQVARVQQDITRLTAQQKELTRELERGYIVAPYRAQLAERNAEVGDLVPSGRPFFRIFEAAQPIVELNVPTEVASKIEVGQEVGVNHNGEVVQATVASKSPELDTSSRTQLMTLSLTGADANADWTYGDVVEVQFLVATENRGFWLPYSALQREVNGLWSAYVLENEGEEQTVGRRVVEILQLEAEHALVRGSLAEGDFYVVDGLNRLVPGQLVAGNLVENEFRQPVPPGTVE